MSNVIVALFSNPVTAVTDSSGNFTLTGVSAGTHTLRVFESQADFDAGTPLAELANVAVAIRASGRATLNGASGSALELQLDSDGSIGVSSDDNEETGVTVVVIPLLLAGAALAIAKKRK
jgi:hypothetical protein